MEERTWRNISWIKSALKEFNAFPKSARDEIADALSIAAEGYFTKSTKRMKGLGENVYQIALRHRGDAYRVVYLLKIDDDIWIVHAFKKKSTKGIKTPKHEIDLIRARISKLKEVLS